MQGIIVSSVNCIDYNKLSFLDQKNIMMRNKLSITENFRIINNDIKFWIESNEANQIINHKNLKIFG